MRLQKKTLSNGNIRYYILQDVYGLGTVHIGQLQQLPDSMFGIEEMYEVYICAEMEERIKKQVREGKNNHPYLERMRKMILPVPAWREALRVFDL